MTITFKDLKVLLEKRLSVDALAKIHSNIDISHDTMAKHKKPLDIIGHFSQHADPTNEKKYTQWIVNRYKKKDFRQEDHPRIHTALKDFETHKNKLAVKDINQYKSLNDLEDAVHPHLGVVSKKQEKQEIKHQGADLVHNEPGLMVHKLKTREAACHYGAGTKWCTAAKHNNMFDQYNKKGPLYVVTTPKEKYQFHFESDQFADSKDRMKDLSSLIKEHPQLKNVEAFKSSSHGIHFHDKKESKNYISDVFK